MAQNITLYNKKSYMKKRPKIKTVKWFLKRAGYPEKFNTTILKLLIVKTRLEIKSKTNKLNKYLKQYERLHQRK